MNALALKIIALVSMFIDHFAVAFPSFFSETGFLVMRCVGRVAFPIFAFLIARGCVYTKDRRRYFLRILLLAVISQIPYTYALHSSKANILFTLAASVAAIILLENIRSRNHRILSAVFLIPICFASPYLDYGWKGVLLIVLLYYIQEPVQTGWFLVFALMLIYNPIRSRDYLFYYLSAVVAVPFLVAYNSRQGYKGRVLQYGFYLLYPLHLAVYSLLKLWLGFA
ncbi:MAG: hypothetical protein E7476_11080 [Ruminococcaceae bacterium]|nr:hypothetical protein [Oscillospiraceae bacterium]